jgi:hypothetical protein
LKQIRFFFVLRLFFPKAKDIRPIKSHLFVCVCVHTKSFFNSKFEILLLFASNKFEEEDFKKRTKDFASDLRARAVFCRGREKSQWS